MQKTKAIPFLLILLLLAGAAHQEEMAPGPEKHDEDLKAFLSLQPLKAVRDAMLGYDFSSVLKRLENLEGKLKTKAYEGHLNKIAAGPAGAALLLTRLKSAVQENRLMQAKVLYPDLEEGETCRIQGLMENGEGLKLLITQKKQSKVCKAPFSRFKSAHTFIHLLDERFPMKGKDKLLLAEAALHFACAECAAHLDPLAGALKRYDPERGWNKSAGIVLDLDPLLLRIAPQLVRLADEALALDSELLEAADALKEHLAEEELAVETFYQGLAPFLDPRSKTAFDQAEAILNAFARNYSGTIFFWYVMEWAGPSARPGAHLVKIGP